MRLVRGSPLRGRNSFEDGTWTRHVYSRVRDYYTRSLVLLDEGRDRLYVFATSPTCSGGKIYYKGTNLEDISFEEGLGTLLVEGEGGTKIGDATSTKQNLRGDMGAMVVASSTSGDYYYNLLQPDGEERHQWQTVDPESVKVLPATGTNFQP